MKSKKTYGQQLRFLMEKHDYTHEDIRDFCRCAYTTAISNWLTDRHLPSKHNQEKLHELFPELPVNVHAKDMPNMVSRPHKGHKRRTSLQSLPYGGPVPKTVLKPVPNVKVSFANVDDGFMAEEILDFGLDRAETLIEVLRGMERLRKL